ncbi:MAG: orotidine-5'-phosphate decarboxylase [Streptosporangiaceae bacterium]
MTGADDVVDVAPIAVALDAPDLDTAIRWTRRVAPHVSAVKVGLGLYLRYGQEAVDSVRSAGAGRVFLDLKLHDIPATVAEAARAVSALEPAYLTVHAAGGAAMIRAAVDCAGPSTRITAVTVLTSLSGDDLVASGVTTPPLDVVLRRAVLAVSAGARAVVCSPREVAAVRAEVGPEVRLLTPGVRPAGYASHDQRRVAPPSETLAAGADLLVIGRPITDAADPGAAAGEMAAELRR